MKTLLVLAAVALLCLSLGSAAEQPKQYVCSPCGMPCDKAVYDKPGSCPVCGSRLVDRKAAEAILANRAPDRRVGILIFNGVEIIDYTGPWEVFGTANFDVYTVAETKEPITTAMGMTVVPNYTFADAPRPDIFLVPGGNVHPPLSSAATMTWVKQEAAAAQTTMSVCNGAFILAAAGLLDGLSATTTFHLLDKLQTDFPKIKVVTDRRFVDNGRIVTAGGLSSGIDGALHLVARLLGQGTAQVVALSMEYDWRPQSGFSRGALAASLIPELDLDDLGTWTIVSTEGGADRWEIVARATSPLSAADLTDRLGRALETRGKWTGTGGAARTPPSSLTRGWTFNGRDGRPWTGTLAVETVPGQGDQYTATLKIARTGPGGRRSAASLM